MSAIRSSDRASRPSRRDFLKLATSAVLGASGVIGAAGLIRFLDFQAEPMPPNSFDLGPASNYPPDSRTVAPDIPALIVHTASGFQALSLVCTHLGCTVQQTQGGFACPCHGSRYDPQGSVTRGPAQQPLRQLDVEVNDSGHLVVRTG